MIYHFIVNPRARSGLGEMLWKQLEPELCRKRIDYQIHLTTKKKDAGKIASEITKMVRSTCLLFLEATVHSMKY